MIVFLSLKLKLITQKEKKKKTNFFQVNEKKM